MAAQIAGGYKGRAGPAERVQNRIARFRESLDDGVENADRLLGGVQAVAGIAPRDDVGRWMARWRGVALGQQIGLFVPVFREAGAGGVFFRKDNVTGDAETRFLPRRHEEVDPVPRIKAQACSAVLQDAVYLGEGRFQPVGVVVVPDLA